MYSTTGRWPRPNQPKQNLESFAYKSQEEINQLRSALTEIEDIFNNQSDIYPCDCDRATRSLNSLNNATKQFYSALSEWNMLPENMISTRYPTLLCLANLSERAEYLLPMLSEYRNICLEPSRQTSRLQKQIAKNMGDLLDKLHRFGIESSSFLG